MSQINLNEPNHKKLGNDQFRKGDYEEAIKHYQIYVENDTNPDNQQAYSNLALCYFKIKKYEQCIEACRQAIEIDDRIVKCYYRRIKARMALEEIQCRNGSSQKLAYAIYYDILKFMSLCDKEKDETEVRQLQTILKDKQKYIFCVRPQRTTKTHRQQIGIVESVMEIHRDELSKSAESWITTQGCISPQDDTQHKLQQLSVNETRKNTNQIHRQRIIINNLYKQLQSKQNDSLQNSELISIIRDQVKLLEQVKINSQKQSNQQELYSNSNHTNSEEQYSSNDIHLNQQISIEQSQFNHQNQLHCTQYKAKEQCDQSKDHHNQQQPIKTEDNQKNQQHLSLQIATDCDTNSQSITKQHEDKQLPTHPHSKTQLYDCYFMSSYQKHLKESHQQFQAFYVSLLLILQSNILSKEQKEYLLELIPKQFNQFKMMKIGFERQWKNNLAQLFFKHGYKQQLYTKYGIQVPNNDNHVAE